MAIDFASAYTKGIAAYNNAATAAKGITPSTGNDDDVASSSFSGLMQKVLGNSVTAVRKSERISAAALVNKAPLDQVVTSVNDAEVTLQTVVAIRDRVISAYQDILKMPI